MKLRKIKWRSHEILGDLLLDFTNTATGKPYDTIVIAGENGTGKTSILESIYNFLNVGPISPFEFIEYQVDKNIFQAVPTHETDHENFFDIKDITSGKLDKIRYDRSFSPQKLRTTSEDPRHYGSVYTKARTNFTSSKISAITTKKIDDDIYENIADDDARSLKQLFIDIKNQDDSDLSKRLKSSPNVSLSWREFEPQTRIYRFSSAFNTFFENKLTFDRIEPVGNGYEVFFKKNNKDILLEKLSTGESQIVFRGAYLLKNVGKLNGGVIFIDEPEISMHPKWQKKILSYYKNLFTYNSCQKVQIIVATHSESVIEQALNNNNTQIIILRLDKNGAIKYGNIDTPLALNNNSKAEIAYQTFGIASTDYHNALYGYIEAEGWMKNYRSNKKLFEYKKINHNGRINYINICLSEKIRHMIHHPENKYNTYTEEELKESIKEMREFILSQKNE